MQKTLLALQSALGTLMIERGYDRLTLQHILDRANVGRSTFYSHFRDKDALLVRGLDAIIPSFDPPTGLASEQWLGFTLEIFEHAAKQKRLYRAFAGGRGGSIVRQFFRSALLQRVALEARRWRPRAGVPVEAAIPVVVDSLIAVVSWWLESERGITPSQADAAFRGLVLPGLKESFTRR